MTIDDRKKNVFPLAIIGILFFTIGFGIGISGFLTPALKDAFNLSNMQSYLIIASIFSAFVIFGKPSGRLITKIGYRKSIVVSLLIMAIGMSLYIPSALFVSFPLFLIASFVGGIGNTILQASVNPYVTLLGKEESAAKRMSLMGILNKTAWWVAPVFLGMFINLNEVLLQDVSIPFIIVSLLILLLSVLTFFSPIPEITAPGENTDINDKKEIAGSKFRLSEYPNLYLGAIALFLYVGIETLPMVSVIEFSKASFRDIENPESFSKFVTIGMVIGYLFGVTAIPKIISQTTALRLFSLIGITSSLLLIYSRINLAFYGLLFVSFANSIMWPAIWPLAISGLGKHTQKGASLLVMAIVGGAVIPIIYGFLVDVISNFSSKLLVECYQKAYWLLVPCYGYILYFAVYGHKLKNKKK